MSKSEKKGIKKTIAEAQSEIDRIEEKLATLDVDSDEYVKLQKIKCEAVDQLNKLKSDQPKHKHPLELATGIAGIVIGSVSVGAEVCGHIIRSDGAKTAMKNSLNGLTKFFK